MIKIKNRKQLLDNASSSSTRRARELALNAIEKALNAVNPESLMKSKVVLDGDMLKIDGRELDLSDFRRVFIVGGGKASGSMAEALEEILGDRIETGVVVVPRGTSGKYNTSRIEIHEASHPIPSSDSVEGARKIMKIAEHAGEKDLILCLISGGGSSLMAMPRPEVSLDDKKRVTQMLLRSGATINEINAVRKHISAFKGGMLAKEAYPASLVSIILSDVIGDNLDVIASGPTVPDTSTYEDAMTVLKRYELWETIPNSVKKVLLDGVRSLITETPKPGDKVFKKVHNIIIGNNRLATSAAAQELQHYGINTVFLTSFLEGEARDVGLMLAAIALEIFRFGNPVPKPAAIVLGGETTVTVVGNGIGGRNQEVALSAATKIEGLDGMAIASATTDGIDGPTDAAGAIVDGGSMTRARRLGLNASDYLRNNDSYSFFSKMGDLMLTGPTGTNVNDLSVVVVI
ncbi:MAG: glycerate kinase [Candidatus Bathyarchaeia archaeon]